MPIKLSETQDTLVITVESGTVTSVMFNGIEEHQPEVLIVDLDVNAVEEEQVNEEVLALVAAGDGWKEVY